MKKFQENIFVQYKFYHMTMKINHPTLSITQIRLTINISRYETNNIHMKHRKNRAETRTLFQVGKPPSTFPRPQKRSEDTRNKTERVKFSRKRHLNQWLFLVIPNLKQWGTVVRHSESERGLRRTHADSRPGPRLSKIKEFKSDLRKIWPIRGTTGSLSSSGIFTVR